MRLHSFLVPWLVAAAAGASSLDLTARDLASTIWNDIKNSGGCAGCKVRATSSLARLTGYQTALSLLKLVDAFGDSGFVNAITEICETSGVRILLGRSGCV
jgi:hypothetical protein